MRPDERLPMNRTESMRLTRPPCRDEDALARERPRWPQERLGARDDLGGLGHAPDADLAFGELAARRADDLHAAREQQLVIRAGRRVLPHAGVHRRCDEDRAVVREDRLGEHVVREPVREPGHRVRRERGDHDQVGALQVRIRIGRHRVVRASA